MGAGWRAELGLESKIRIRLIRARAGSGQLGLLAPTDEYATTAEAGVEAIRL